MPARRTLHRCVTAFSVVLALLFSQLALANYVCPGSIDALAMAEMMVAGTPCEGMDAAQPALCHQSAAGAPQSVATINVAAPFLPTAVQVLVVPIVAHAPLALASRFATTAEAHQTSAAKYVSLAEWFNSGTERRSDEDDEGALQA